MTDRTPPNDEHAERALIGYALRLGKIPDEVDGLAPSDFYRPINEMIWAAMQVLAKRRAPVDLTSVRDHLQIQACSTLAAASPAKS